MSAQIVQLLVQHGSCYFLSIWLSNLGHVINEIDDNDGYDDSIKNLL